jgi:hypothetical protein
MANDTLFAIFLGSSMIRGYLHASSIRNSQRLIVAPRPSRLVLEIDVGERLPIGVADDEAGVGLLDGPWRWEAAGLRHRIVL